MDDGKAVGVFTVTDLVRAIANNKEDLLVGDLMTTNIVIVNEDMRIANAIEIMLKKQSVGCLLLITIIIYLELLQEQI